MKGAIGICLLLVGALVLTYVFTEPGDQTALAAIGGSCVGYGIFLSAFGLATRS